MLQRVQAQVGELRRLRMVVDRHHPTLVFKFVASLQTARHYSSLKIFLHSNCAARRPEGLAARFSSFAAAPAPSAPASPREASSPATPPKPSLIPPPAPTLRRHRCK